MEQVIEILNQNIIYILLALIGITFIFLILIIVLFGKNRRLKNKYDGFLRGSETDIEGLLTECIRKTDAVQGTHESLETSIRQIQTQLKRCVQKVGVVRYSAVSDVGSDLSFTIALLNEEDNGVVMNGIYTRDGSYTYAKPIAAGKSKHTLSDEEKEAIRISINVEE